MTTGYINNSYPYMYQQQQQQYAAANPQFTGLPAEAMSNEDPTLGQLIFNPFNLLFAPLTMSDPLVKKYKAEAMNLKGWAQKKDFLKGKLNFKNISNEAFVKPSTNRVIKSYAKQFNTNDVAKLQKLMAKEGVQVEKALIKETTKDFKAVENLSKSKKLGEFSGKYGMKYVKYAGNKINSTLKLSKGSRMAGNAVRKGFSKIGVTGKLLRKVPLVGTILFGACEIPEIGSAFKHSTGEGVKQVGRSATKIGASLGGWAAGAAAGAAIGSVIPGAGTAVGAVIGAACSLIGGLVGSHVAEKGAEGIYDAIFGEAKHKPQSDGGAGQQNLFAQQQGNIAFSGNPNSNPFNGQQAYAPAYAGSGQIKFGDEWMTGSYISL